MSAVVDYLIKAISCIKYKQPSQNRTRTESRIRILELAFKTEIAQSFCPLSNLITWSRSIMGKLYMVTLIRFMPVSIPTAYGSFCRPIPKEIFSFDFTDFN